MCDEFALIHADTLELHPFPRAICIKKAAFPVVESLDLTQRGSRHYHKGTKGDVAFLSPGDARPGSVGRACPIRYVIFPKYKPKAVPALVPIHRAEAAFVLHEVCFNLWNCERIGLDVLAGMIRGASCYRLISSEIGQTCDLVQDLVTDQSRVEARSA